MKIGVFDSGVGGITVLTELRNALSTAEFVYLGDNLNLPYGGKSAAQVERLSLEAADRFIEKGVELLVVACNTISSVALEALREKMGRVPVVGVVEPGAQAAVASWVELGSPGAPVLVLATRGTIRSGAYGRAIAGLDAQIPVVEQECPLLAPMIEEGWLDHPILHATIGEYVKAHTGPGVALLGCTHYPWIQAAFERALPGWTVVNSAVAVARELRERVGAALPSGHQPPKIEWIFTDPQAVPKFAQRWF